MSREQYTPPSISQPGQPGASSANQNYNTGGGGGGGGFNFSGASGSIPDDTSRPVSYLCGDCDAKVSLKKGDAIRCKECGYRVLYKERTSRVIQFEAR